MMKRGQIVRSFGRKMALAIVAIAVALLLGALNDLSRNDRILLTASLTTAVILWDMVSARLQKYSPLLEAVLFYTTVIAFCSFFVPIIDVIVMAIAAFVYEAFRWSGHDDIDNRSEGDSK